MILKIHAPLFGEQVDIQCGARAFVGNQLGDVKANTARAHDCHLLANRLVALNGIDIAHHLLVVHSGNIRHTWIDAGGHHNMIKIGSLQLRRIDPLTQLHSDRVFLQHRPVITQRLVELLFAGHLFCQIKLTANLLCGVKQRHRVAALCRYRGVSQPGRTGTHHSNIFDRRRRTPLDQGLVTGAWVDQARRGLHRKRVV